MFLLIHDVEYTAAPSLIQNLPKFIYVARELLRNTTPTECSQDWYIEAWRVYLFSTVVPIAADMGLL